MKYSRRLWIYSSAALIAVAIAFLGFAVIGGESSHEVTVSAESGGDRTLIAYEKAQASTQTRSGGGVAANDPPVLERPQRATDIPQRETDLLSSDVRRVAATVRSGSQLGVYVGRQSGAVTCLILQDERFGGGGGGGCNPAADPFAGSSVWWSSVHTNGSTQELAIFGVVANDVSSIQLEFKGGERSTVPLSADGGFLHVIAKEQIVSSDVPEAIVSLDDDGQVTERIGLGITFGG